MHKLQAKTFVPEGQVLTYMVYAQHYRGERRHIAHFRSEMQALRCAKALETYYSRHYTCYIPDVFVLSRLWSVVETPETVMAFSNTGQSVPVAALMTMVDKNDDAAASSRDEDIPHTLFGEFVVTPLPWWRLNFCMQLLTCLCCLREVPRRVYRLGHSVGAYSEMSDTMSGESSSLA